MIRLGPILLPFCLVFGLAGCMAPSGPERTESASDASRSVWAIDLARTLPGAQEDYVRSIETNWANGRRLALERGVVKSYHAFVAPQDSARGWDVLFITEYADSAAWYNREQLFEDIFASPEFVRVEPARPSSEMREFVTSEVLMRSFVAPPRKP